MWEFDNTYIYAYKYILDLSACLSIIHAIMPLITVYINCSAVDLHLSTDNGESFDFHIARGISNNGSAIVYIPANVPDSTTARFKLSCSSNIFFSISSQSFSIGQELPQPQETTRSEETITTAQESSLSGGGSIGYLLLALVLLVIMNKKQTLSWTSIHKAFCFCSVFLW